MDAKEVVRYMAAAIEDRKECLALAFDRGLGEGMKIENWILTEMLAKLVELEKDGVLDSVEGEHKYPEKKSSRYEHCDLWWRVKGNEHWLEVKTVKNEKEVREVVKDLEKRCRLRHTDIFHHLSILFSESSSMEDQRRQLASAYKQYGFSCEADWSRVIEGNRQLRFILFVHGGNVQD